MTWLIRKINLSWRIIYRYLGLEGFIWLTALVCLAFFVNPNEMHFSFCPLSNAGFDHCPGCGLGRSISLLLNGKILQSIETHILAIPAILFLFVRIISLIKFNSNLNKLLNNEERTQHA